MLQVRFDSGISKANAAVPLFQTEWTHTLPNQQHNSTPHVTCCSVDVQRISDRAVRNEKHDYGRTVLSKDERRA